MKINNTIKSTNYNPNFSALNPSEIGISKKYLTTISNRSENLMKNLNNHIETLWTKKKKGEYEDTIKFFLSGRKGEVALIEPIYGTPTPVIKMEIMNGDRSNVFFFERKNPHKFRYEKNVSTQFGFATLKTYNSATEHNTDINALADAKIQEYVPKIVHKSPYQDFNI